MVGNSKESEGGGERDREIDQWCMFLEFSSAVNSNICLHEFVPVLNLISYAHQFL